MRQRRLMTVAMMMNASLRLDLAVDYQPSHYRRQVKAAVLMAVAAAGLMKIVVVGVVVDP